MKNNKGFTLVELVIVVAIIAISITFVGATISSVFSYDNKKCIRSLDASISQCRVNAMSREGSPYMKVVRKEDGIYCEFYEKGKQVSTEKIGKKKVTLTIVPSWGGEWEVTQGKPLYLSFHRGTGSFMSLSGAENLENPSVPIEDIYCKKISAKGSQETISVVLVPPTGKHYVEKGGE